MNIELSKALLGLAGSVVTAWLVWRGVRFTQAQAARASTQTAQIERVKVDAAAYESARETWEDMVAGLRAQVDWLTQGQAALRGRVDELEFARKEDQRRINVLTEWARVLLRWLRDNQITGHPEPPEELSRY